jgi:membrane-associated phospholipid phosphatase
VICALAAGRWLFYRFQPPRQQRISNHLLLTAVTTAIIPHILKKAFNQRRPDRVMIKAHLHGVPFSGKARDAFPSGHAIHMGALASAASRLPTPQRNTIWAISGGLVLTRVILLAHWASDVIAGLAIGAALERA